jgi:hypothetical protein
VEILRLLGEAKKIPVFATGVTETDLRTPVRDMYMDCNISAG